MRVHDKTVNFHIFIDQWMVADSIHGVLDRGANIAKACEPLFQIFMVGIYMVCLLYTSDAADD